MSRFSLIVLAAGASRRLGRAKQLLPFQNKPLLQHIILQTRDLDWDARILVLGAAAEIILPALDIGGFEPALNPDWETGMASSVRVGVERALARRPDAENLLFLVCDQPFVSAALLRDLRRRGMLDSTLVVWSGEFGRTPFAQGSDGRDHNPQAFSMWMAGGGVRGGIAVGATDDYGYRVVEKKFQIHDLHATMLWLLGIDHTRLTYRFSGRDMRLTDVHGTVIRDVLA